MRLASTRTSSWARRGLAVFKARRGTAAEVLTDELPLHRPLGARQPTPVMRSTSWVKLALQWTPLFRARSFDQDRTESLSPPSRAGTGTRVYMGGGGLAARSSASAAPLRCLLSVKPRIRWPAPARKLSNEGSNDEGKIDEPSTSRGVHSGRRIVASGPGS